MALINPPRNNVRQLPVHNNKTPPVIKYANFFSRFFPFFPFSIRFQLGNSFGNTSVFFLGGKVPLCIRFQLGNSFRNT